jgi:hypothetical protein
MRGDKAVGKIAWIHSTGKGREVSNGEIVHRKIRAKVLTAVLRIVIVS